MKYSVTKSTTLTTPKIKLIGFIVVLFALFSGIEEGQAQVFDGNYTPGEYSDGHTQVFETGTGTCNIYQAWATINPGSGLDNIILGFHIGNPGNSLFRIYIDTDNNPSTGLTLDNFGDPIAINGAEYILEIEAKNNGKTTVYDSTLTEIDTTSIKGKNGDFIAESGTFIEFLIPFSSIGYDPCNNITGGVLNIAQFASVAGGSSSSNLCGSFPLDFEIGSGGNAGADATICSGTVSPMITLNGHNGTILEWQQSTDINFTVPICINETGTTLAGSTIGTLDVTTYFRAVVQSDDFCSGDSSTILFSTPATITVEECCETTTGTDTQMACDSFVWIDGNTYTESNNIATHTLPNAAGCDSVVTLDLTILESSTGTDTQMACDSFVWIDGNTYTESNNIATHTLPNAAGCDSVVTLDLTILESSTGIDTQVACDSFVWIDGNTYTESNNIATHTLPNAAGCDSVVTLDLTILESSTGIDTQMACDSFVWIDGNTYTESNNIATHTLPNAAGCDSVVTLDLTILESSTGTDTQVACDSFVWIDGNTYTESNNIATHTLPNAAGCDSVVTLDLTILESSTGIDTQMACDSFVWIDGNTYTESNNIATHTLPNAAGCDSVVTLDLTILESSTGTDTQVACDSFVWIDGNTYTESNNIATHTLPNAAGCDSVVTLDLTILESSTGTDTQMACDSFVWIDGNTYTESNNIATHTLPNAAGCDSVVTLDLTILESSTGTDTQVACDSFVWIDGNTYTESNNIATHTLPNAAGCDSVVTLDLTILESSTGTDTQMACDSFVWIDGNTYTESNNIATHTLPNAAGCDSVVTLDLTILESSTGTDTQVACDSFVWIDGNTYTESNNIATHTLPNAAGCDSVVTLDLTILESSTGTDTQVACDSFVWIDGNTYTESNNIATHTLPNAAGCDSVVTLDLTILESSTGTDTQVACDSFVWIDGNTYTESNNIATHTLPNAAGCDSVVTLDLTILESSTGTDTQVACDSFVWIDGNTYTESNNIATHTLPNAAGCDSVVTLDLTILESSTGIDTQMACDSFVWIDGNTYTESNNIATHTLPNAAGCDSVVTLDLTILESSTGTDTQVACDSFVWIDGNTYTESNNIATHTLPNAAGCDSVVTLDLTILESSTGTDTQVACDSFVWIDGNTYTESNNIATHTLPNAAGCDSVVTLDLTILESSTGTDTQVACDSFVWIDGNTYTESNNIATHTLPNAAGCDSVVTLDLTILESSTGTDTQVACDSFVWIDGNTYTESNNIATHTLPNAAGCDSVVTLDLTILESSTGTDTQVACDSFVWIDGNTYTESNNIATHTLPNAAGCDSVVTLDLTILESSTGTDTQVACDSFVWIDGNTYTESNNIATHTLPNAAGCDSVVTLDLTILESSTGTDTQMACDSFVWIDGNTYTESNNIATHTLPNAAGCDSVVTLDLTILESSTGIDTQMACDSFVWIDGNTYTESNNIATHTLPNAAGCDSVVTLDLTILESSTGIDTQMACDSFVWIDGNTYTESNNIATHTLPNAAGCDSVVTLDLTINYSTKTEESITACDSYRWNGETYTESGVYSVVLETTQGCDSIATLNLVISDSERTELNIETCDSYIWNGLIYTESGTYTSYSETQDGCQLTSILNLIINNSIETEEIVSACETYGWNGETYNESGIYTATFETVHGCDSIATLNLTINKSVETEEIVSACETYEWNGETYNESGIYTATFETTQGCDSIARLNLTINKSVETEEIITACETYEWNGETYNESGIYTATFETVQGCDSIATLNLILTNTVKTEENITVCDSFVWNETTYTMSGVYTNTFTAHNGCDSVVTLNLTILEDCNQVSIQAINDELTIVSCAGEEIQGVINILENDLGIDNGVTVSIENLPDGFYFDEGYLNYSSEDFTKRNFEITYQICLTDNSEVCSEALITVNILIDSDCDNIPDDDDIDDDNDGLLDIHEMDDNEFDIDSDNDGIVNRLDIDSDGDGIVDNIEWQSTINEGGNYDYIAPSGIDSNGDGWDDAYDPEFGGIYYEAWDMDEDGTPDYLDLDTDNDGIEDVVEGHDANYNQEADVTAFGEDYDSDGLDAAYDTVDGRDQVTNPTGSNAPLQDEDNNGIRDWRDNPATEDGTEIEEESCELIIPDGFSPNADGFNDFFEIAFDCAQGEPQFEEFYPEAKIEIFNRWGIKVWEQENYGNISRWGATNAWWNGTSMHDMQVGKKELPVANYFYILYFNSGDKEPVNGFIFLNN